MEDDENVVASEAYGDALCLLAGIIRGEMKEVFGKDVTWHAFLTSI